ncbi:MAG TPA: TolC family protein [Puia sp.]|uniref:TolC family protein n=1 Tax=Puia sp. TaxID=2045100 RepID=UPI002D14CB6C|nr:TolC family protein [Puia sp.]HVU96622.1 TolC family protein [Puia sp.]
MKRLFIGSGFSLLVLVTSAQKPQQDTLGSATLEACVQYALKHYPLVQQALLDEQITDRQIKSKLADWYPQLNLNANYQNNFQLPSVAFNGATVHSGTYNTSTVGLALTQNIFTRDVLIALKTKGDVMTNIRQQTVSDKIDVTVNVSKAFYDVLLTKKQIDVLNDDIVRLERNYKDAYNQYRGGLVDKTDYKRATITLNNSKAELRTNEEALKAKYQVLKQLMGYTGADSIRLVYDSARMESEVFIDTLQTLDYSKRIEYQQLMTEKRLQQADVKYQKWAYIPTVTAGAGYNLNYLNSRFGPLYNNNFPNSYAGLQVAFPIFQGTKRQQNIRIAELQLTRIDWDIINLQTTISTQYAQALAVYKSNLNNYYVLRENRDLARDVFNTIDLQYRSGVKAYLELITAETDLRTAESNYSDALYQALSSKLDVQKALGTITY